MSVDREFESVLEGWAVEGEKRAQREAMAVTHAELLKAWAAKEPGCYSENEWRAREARRRAQRWACLPTFVPFSSMPFEEGEPHVHTDAHSA